LPEGPEIRRAADRIERAIAGRPADRVRFAFPHLRRFERRLRGARVREVETRGKALLVHFGGGLSIYAHSQLYGRWMVVRAGTRPKTKRSLRLAIHNDQWSALLYSASEIDVLTADGIAAHPFLAKLGPDALARGLGELDLRARIREPRFARRQLHALLLDQSFVAGIGNYLRSEILFAARLHPARRPGDLSAAESRGLARAIARVTRRAYETGGITSAPSRVRRAKAQGLRRAEYRHHVFTRGGRPCWVCGTAIRRSDLGSRQLYHCPTCQPAPGSGGPGGHS